MNNKKGQGAFEYLLLIGGVLFLAVAVIMILRTGVLTTGQQALGNATGQFNETVGCMLYCSQDGTTICNKKCSDSLITGKYYYCNGGDPAIACSGACTDGIGCSAPTPTP